MKRRLFKILAAVSLVLCVALVTASVRSAFGIDELHMWMWDPKNNVHGSDNFYSYGGTFGYQGVRIQNSVSAAPQHIRLWIEGKRPGMWYERSPEAPNRLRSWLWFSTSGQTVGPWWTGYRNLVEVPYWPFIFASGILPFLWWRNARRHYRRTRYGLCLTCGYNLTGNVSGVCPECGTAIPPRPTVEKATS